MDTIREPKQQRAIEKKQRIIEKGFELMCEKGYYKVNTKDIAKYAGVSTGIIYQYFNDKKEIFIAGTKNYSEKILYPTLNILDSNNTNLENIISEIIDKFIKNHTMSKKAHEQLMAMTHLDSDIANVFRENEIKMTDKISNYLKNKKINIKNIEEKVHIIVGLIDNLCHEIIYHKHKEIDYSIMTNEVKKIIIDILNQ